MTKPLSKNEVDTQINVLSGVDYEKMYEIAQAALKDSSIVSKFDKDAAGTARSINGFQPPSGYHMHIVDHNNVYHPKEDDALSQLSSETGKWSRIEVRAGEAQLACIICLWCK